MIIKKSKNVKSTPDKESEDLDILYTMFDEQQDVELSEEDVPSLVDEGEHISEFIYEFQEPPS